MLALVACATFGFGAVDSLVWTAIALAIFAMLAVWALRKLWRPFPLVTTGLYAAPLALALAAAVQCLSGGSETAYSTSGELLRWMAHAAFFLVAVNALSDPAVRAFYLRGFVVIVGLAAAVGICQWLTVPHLVYWFREAPGAQPFGPFANRDHFAVLIELAFPIALTSAFRHRTHKLYYFAVAALLAAAVAGTHSKAAFAIVAIQAAFLTLLFGSASAKTALRSRRRGPRVLQELAGVGLLVCLLLGVGWSVGLLRISSQQGSTGLLPDEALTRGEVRQGAIALIAEKPWLGHGFGAFRQAFRRFAPRQDGFEWQHAQSDPLELVVDAGLAGLLAQVIVLALALWRARNASAWGFVIAPLAGAWAHSWTTSPLHTPAVALAGLALLACLPGLTARRAVKHARQAATTPLSAGSSGAIVASAST